MIDWNATAAWIALAVSILAPSITTLITCFYNRKIHKEDLAYKREQETVNQYAANMRAAYDEFAEAVGVILSMDPGRKSAESYMASRAKLAAYLPDGLRSDLFKVSDYELLIGPGQNQAGARNALQGLLNNLAGYVYLLNEHLVPNKKH